MMVMKRKQIVVLSLVLMIVVAGYLQYSYKKTGDSASTKDTGKLGEAVYVDSQAASAKKATEAQNAKSASTTSQSKDFFTQAKLERETVRSKDTETLKSIVNDAAAVKEARTKAQEQMNKILANSDKEMRMETLIREKGFSDAVALFGDDGSIDIVVKSPNLTSAQTAQIADIAARQANLAMTKIHVRNTQ